MPAFDIQHAIGLLEQGRAGEAISVLQHLVEAMPAYVTAHVLLARAYEAEQQWQQAQDVWHRAQFFMPNSPTIHQGIARVNRRMAASWFAAGTWEEAEPDVAEEGSQEEPVEGMTWVPLEEPTLDVHIPEDEDAGQAPAVEEAPFEDRSEMGVLPFDGSADDAAPVEVPDLEVHQPEREPPPVVPEDAGPDDAAPEEAEAGVRWQVPVPPEDPDAFVDLTDLPDAPPVESASSVESDSSVEPEPQADAPQFDAPREAPYLSDLDRLIDELESARIVPRPDLDALPPPDLEDDIEDVVSETLARIYASQRQFDEAARVYELLSAQQPERAAEFLRKAEEMRARASDR